MPTHHHRRHHDHHRRHPPPTTSSPQSKPDPTKQLSLLLLKSIIMALILSLFLLFLGFAALLLLHFLILSITSNLHRHRRYHTTTPISSYSPQHLLTFLPSFNYVGSAQTPTRDCPICLDVFKEGERCRKLPSCNHFFHVGCVDKWLIKVPNCPVCRTQVRLDSGIGGTVIGEDEFKPLWDVGV